MAEPWALLIGLGIVLGAWLGPVGLLVAVWLVVAIQSIRGSFRWLPLIVVMGSVVIGAWRAEIVLDVGVAPAFVSSSGGQGTLVSMPKTSSWTQTVDVKVDRLETSTGDVVQVDPFDVRITMPASEELDRGDTVRLVWSPDRLENVSPGFAGYLRANGITGLAWAESIAIVEDGPWFYRVVQQVRDRIEHEFSGLMDVDTGALASGIVTGNDSGLSGDVEEAFRATGTSHVTAVSGSNIAMVLAIWNLFLPVGRGRRLLAIQLALVGSIWIYAVMTGLEPPASRAAGMATIMLFGGRFGRRPDPMSLLAISAGLMVLWNPLNVELISFWLSVVASAAIISRVPFAPVSGWSSFARGVFEGTMLAQLATLPLVLLAFGAWSPIGILANALVAPLMSLAFPLCFLLAIVVVIVPALGPLLAWLPEVALAVCIAVVEVLADVVPPISMERAGLAGALALIVPCLAALMLMSRDGQRWIVRVHDAWRKRPAAVWLVSIAPLSGILLAALLRAFWGQ